MSVEQPLIEKKQHSFFERHAGAMYMAIAAYGVSHIQLGIKLLSQDGVQVPQMLLMRNVLILLVLFGVSLYVKPAHGLLGPPRIRCLLLTRALLGNASLLLSMTALTLLPLGDAATLSMISPAITLLLSPLLLGECFGIVEMIPILISSAGILLVARPPFIFGDSSYTAESGLGMLLAIAGAIFLSTSDLLVRKIGDRAHFIHLIFYVSIVAIIPSSVWCLLHLESLVFSLPVLIHTLVMFAGALITQVFTSRSLQVERVSRVAPIVSLQILFAFFNDWLLFGVTPPASTLGAAALIAFAAIFSCLTQ